MDSKIDKGRIEFHEENYDKALDYFDAVDEDDEDYDFVLIFKITCLMELERYDKALFLIDSLLNEQPRDELLLYEKIRCHIALNEKSEAIKTLNKFERIISKDDKRMLLDISRFYRFLGDFKKALKFCNMALDVDGNFEDALYEQSLIAIALDDKKLINQSADGLLNLIGENNLEVLPIFLLKMYSGKFGECLSLIENLKDNLDEDTYDMLKVVVFNQLCESLDVNIHLTENVDISLDEAIGLMMDYDERGTKCGIINDVGFVIM